MIDSIVHLFDDSGGYLSYAGTMLSSWDWLHTTNIDTYREITHHRLPFYPALLAITQLLFGKSGSLFFIVMLQFSLLGLAIQRVYSFSQKLGFTKFYAYCLSLTLLITIPFYYACSILPDSLYTSCGVIAFVSTALYFMHKHTKYDLTLLILSLALMMLLKESALYFAFLLLPFILVLLFHKKTKHSTTLLALIFIPVLSIYALTLSWNFYRSGTFFLTSGLSTALASPILDLKNEYPGIKYQSVIDSFLPETHPYIFADGLHAISLYKTASSLNTIEVQNIIKQEYIQSWGMFPLQRAAIAFESFTCARPYDVFNPLRTVQLFIEHDQVTKFPRLRQLLTRDDLKTIKLSEALQVLGMTFFRVISTLLVLWGIYKLYVRLRARNKTLEDWTYICLALHAVSWIALISAVHLEPRYIMTSYAIFALLALAPPRKNVTSKNLY